jgi:hypothetical protein
MARSYWYFQLRTLPTIFLCGVLGYVGALFARGHWGLAIGVIGIVVVVFGVILLLRWARRERLARERRMAEDRLSELSMKEGDDFPPGRSFATVYDIRDRLPLGQGTKVTPHGIFRSDEWYEAFHRGDVPTFLVCGCVTRLFWAGHNDYAMFEVTSVAGPAEESRFGDLRAYKLGRAVRLTYATIELCEPDAEGETSFNWLARIELEDH